MAKANIRLITDATPPPPKQFEDEGTLKLCLAWRAARAQQQKNWAEYEMQTMWGTLPDAHIDLDLAPLERMHEIQDILSDLRPKTLLCALEMLRIVITILAKAEEDPDGEESLGKGPILPLVRNVVKSLEFLEYEMPVGPPANRKRQRRRVQS